MCAYDYIKSTGLEPLLNIGNLLRSAKTAHIVYIAWKILQSRLECLEMLEGQNSCRHEHSYLLAVGNCLECSSYRHFRLSETNIATDKSVHRTIVLHIPFNSGYSLFLIRCILIHERRFQLLLHIRISRKGKTLGPFSLCIQLYKILRYILDLGFSAGLEILPCLRA